MLSKQSARKSCGAIDAEESKAIYLYVCIWYACQFPLSIPWLLYRMLTQMLFLSLSLPLSLYPPPPHFFQEQALPLVDLQVPCKDGLVITPVLCIHHLDLGSERRETALGPVPRTPHRITPQWRGEGRAQEGSHEPPSGPHRGGQSRGQLLLRRECQQCAVHGKMVATALGWTCSWRL